MDDIESTANQLSSLIYATTDGAANAGGVATVNTAGDHNEWGKMNMRPTRHSLSEIPDANGKVRLDISQRAVY